MSIFDVALSLSLMMMLNGWAEVHAQPITEAVSETSAQTAKSEQSGTSSVSIPDSKTKLNASTACEMARYRYLAKAAENNPQLIEAITRHHKAAKILVCHPKLAEIADADMFLCRRLTRWNDVACMLASSPEGERVVELDPEGIYRAIEHDKSIARALSNNPKFKRLIAENPRLRRLIATSM